MPPAGAQFWFLGAFSRTKYIGTAVNTAFTGLAAWGAASSFKEGNWKQGIFRALLAVAPLALSQANKLPSLKVLRNPRLNPFNYIRMKRGLNLYIGGPLEALEFGYKTPPTTWTRPPGWRLPKNGTWSGTPGHSDFLPTNPQALGLQSGAKIPFRYGYANFSEWQWGKPFNVLGLNGNHQSDMTLIHREIARQMGLANQSAAEAWLTQQGLSPHHAGGISVQLIPRDLHGGVRHMGGAWELRNQ